MENPRNGCTPCCGGKEPTLRVNRRVGALSYRCRTCDRAGAWMEDEPEARWTWERAMAIKAMFERMNI